MRAAAESFRPDIVLHGGAFTAVDACESDPDTAFAVNALGTRNIAEAARAVGAHLVYVSTDYVFDGTPTGRTSSGTNPTRFRLRPEQAGRASSRCAPPDRPPSCAPPG